MFINNRRNFGNTDIKVSPLGFGTYELRRNSVGKKEASELLNIALDNGINYIDTSASYGKSEELIGKTIAHRRDEFILATKCGHKIDEKGNIVGGYDWSRDNLFRSLDNSLKLMKTDYVDVMQLHNIEPEKHLQKGKDSMIIKTLEEMKGTGKVRYIGVSFRNSQKGDELYPSGYAYKGLKQVKDWGAFDVIQVVYGALIRKSELLIKRASDKGIAIVVRGILNRYFDNYEELFKKAKLQDFCGDDENINDFLIRFALSTPGISTMIIGTKNPVHLKSNIEIVNKGKLSEVIYEKAKKRLDRVGVKPVQP